MPNPAADFPAALHSPTNVSAFGGEALGGTSPNQTELAGKVEQELVATQVKLGAGASVPASNLVLIATGTGTSAWGSVSLTANVSGILPIANGGTGANLSATGGTSNVLKQTSVGGVVTVAQLAASDLSNGVTGSGSVVLATSPTLVTPALGTPASGTLTNAIGLPIATGVSGLGTGVATFLATPSSANLLSAMTTSTGSGNLVFGTSPSLTTPTIGVATATSINKVTITAPATSATLTIANSKTLTASNSITLAGTDGKTLTVSNNLTLAGTDATTMTFPSTSATIARIDAANTFTGVQTFSSLPTVPQTPSAATDAASKGYVDATAQGLSVKASVQVATTAALPTNTYSGGVITVTATGFLTVDGVAVGLNDRVLVKNEVTGANNGIYLCTTAGGVGVAAVLTRATDSNTAAGIIGGFTFVETGTVNAAAGFVNTNNVGGFTLGTTAITYTQFSGAGEISAGTGLAKSGNTLSIESSGVLQIAHGGTAATAATGTGNVVLASSPTLVTPVLGVATATSINSLTITTSTGTLTITNGKTLTIDKSLEFDGTDSTKMTFPSSSDTVVGLAATQSPTNKTFDNTNSLTVKVGNFLLEDGADTTKQLAFTASGNTTGIKGTIAAAFTTAKTVTLPDATDTLVGKATTDTLTNKTIAGANNTLTVRLASDVTGNLPVANLGSGTGATSSTFWRGDGTWAAPSSTGFVTGPGSSTDGHVALFSGASGTVLQDGGKGIPSGAIVGTSDSQTLTNKAMSEAQITFTDITTGNVSTSAHGFVPKAPNDAGKFLDGTGAFTSAWWVELGRTTLGSAGNTISLTPITAMTHLQIIIYSTATGGTTRFLVRFNNDSASNYANRDSSNAGADATNVSQSAGGTLFSSLAQEQTIVGFVTNVTAQEKLMQYTLLTQGTAGAGNVPNRTNGVIKWANTAAQITRIDIINDGTGNFNTGSELIVLGHN